MLAASVLLALLLGPAAAPAPCTVVQTIGNGLGAPFLWAPAALSVAGLTGLVRRA